MGTQASEVNCCGDVDNSNNGGIDGNNGDDDKCCSGGTDGKIDGSSGGNTFIAVS